MRLQLGIAALAAALAACANGIQDDNGSVSQAEDQRDAATCSPPDAGAADAHPEGGGDAATADARDAPDAEDAGEDADDATAQCSLSLPSGSPACDTCLEGACCAEDNACGGSAACTDVMSCYDNCAGADAADVQTCTDACDAQNPGGAALVQAWMSCVQSTCRTPCFGP